LVDACPLEFKEHFLDCLVAALEVRRTTEDDGITAYFVSPQAFKHTGSNAEHEEEHGPAQGPKAAFFRSSK
jgi:hypothetical protein